MSCIIVPFLAELAMGSYTGRLELVATWIREYLMVRTSILGCHLISDYFGESGSCAHLICKGLESWFQLWNLTKWQFKACSKRLQKVHSFTLWSSGEVLIVFPDPGRTKTAPPGLHCRRPRPEQVCALGHRKPQLEYPPGHPIPQLAESDVRYQAVFLKVFRVLKSY